MYTANQNAVHLFITFSQMLADFLNSFTVIFSQKVDSEEILKISQQL